MMLPYPKIQTVWDRDPETNYSTLIEGQWARPEFEVLEDLMWRWEEKIDGTNIRVIWDDETVHIRGRKEKSEVPDFLEERLREILPVSKFETEYPDVTRMALYGEGYGHKVQKRGDKYLPDTQGFILFDVWIDGLWLKREDVLDIASHLSIPTPARWGIGPLEKAIEMVSEGFQSFYGSFEAEGLVLRPPRILFDRRERRIITKVKCSDFK